MHAHSLHQAYTLDASKSLWILKWTCLANILTSAMRSDPTPPSIDHAGKSAVSLQGVPSVTGVGHCGTNSCTRATLMTICRGIGGRTTADSCREGTGTTFPVATIQAHSIQCKLKGMQVYTCTIMQANYIYIYICMYMHVPYTSIKGWCMWIHVSECTYVPAKYSWVCIYKQLQSQAFLWHRQC